MGKVTIGLMTAENGRRVMREAHIDIPIPGALLLRAVVMIDGVALVNIPFALNEWSYADDEVDSDDLDSEENGEEECSPRTFAQE